MNKLTLLLLTLLLPILAHAEQPDAKTSNEKFKDWVVTCVEQQTIKRCEMKQTLANDQNQPVAVFSLAKKDKNQTILQIALPHLVDLGVPVVLTVDGKKVASLPYKFCNRTACFVFLDNNEDLIGAFKKGQGGELEARLVNQAGLKFKFSLNGFSAALQKLPLSAN